MLNNFGSKGELLCLNYSTWTPKQLKVASQTGTYISINLSTSFKVAK